MAHINKKLSGKDKKISEAENGSPIPGSSPDLPPYATDYTAPSPAMNLAPAATPVMSSVMTPVIASPRPSSMLPSLSSLLNDPGQKEKTDSELALEVERLRKELRELQERLRWYEYQYFYSQRGPQYQLQGQVTPQVTAQSAPTGDRRILFN